MQTYVNTHTGVNPQYLLKLPITQAGGRWRPKMRKLKFLSLVQAHDSLLDPPVHVCGVQKGYMPSKLSGLWTWSRETPRGGGRRTLTNNDVFENVGVVVRCGGHCGSEREKTWVQGDWEGGRRVNTRWGRCEIHQMTPHDVICLKRSMSS